MKMMFRMIIASALISITGSCTKDDRTPLHKTPGKKTNHGAAEADSLFSPGIRMGELKEKKLNEVSGLAASIANPGMLWTHNDSGNSAEIYLIDTMTNIRQTYVLKGISNRDWEEIALGPGPVAGRQYLYVGDIGDNAAIHAKKYIYRFEEPVFTSGDEKKKKDIADFDTFTFSLSDERRDTEAFVVDPLTRDIFIIGKWKDPVDVYQLKYSEPGDDLVAQHVGTLPLTAVVAADFNRAGTELLIKTYNHVFYWKRTTDTPVMTMLRKPGTSLPYVREPQGEAITWSASGDGYYTLSERKKGDRIHLMFYARRNTAVKSTP